MPRGAGTPNSADHMIVWTACVSVFELTNAQLDRWRERGVDGFACQLQRLAQMGGDREVQPADEGSDR